MTRLVVVLLLWWALPVSAQSVRTFLSVPVNFQNDTSQPRSLVQLKTDSDALAQRVFGVANSYGAVTTTSTVLSYITVDMNKGCPNGGGGSVLNLPVLKQKVRAELTRQGVIVEPTPPFPPSATFARMTGYTYVYLVSPTTFGKCSHDYNFEFEPDVPLSGGSVDTLLSWRLGLSLSVNWLCRASAGSSTYVTLSGFCGPSPSTANGRDFTALTGQGQSGFTAADRNKLGWLPASHQETVPATTLRGQRTIRYLENPADGLKRLLLSGMGVELSYHAPKTGGTWDIRGVTAHLIGTSSRLDFTPDDKWLFGSTALEPTASWVYNNLRLTVLSADLDVAVVDWRPASDQPPTIPAGPRCATTSPDPSMGVKSLVDGACGVWTINANRMVYRNGSFYAGQADSLTFCHGTVYVPSGAFTPWNRYASGVNGAAMVSMKVPDIPPCTGDPVPPPVDPPPDPVPPDPPPTGLPRDLGCFKDAIPRDLPLRLQPNVTTVPAGLAACTTSGKKYCGLQNGGEVWTGDTVGKYGPYIGTCRPLGWGWVNHVWQMTP